MTKFSNLRQNNVNYDTGDAASTTFADSTTCADSTTGDDSTGSLSTGADKMVLKPPVASADSTGTCIILRVARAYAKN